MRAYLLVTFNPDADLTAVRHAMNQPGVDKLDLLLGPYDAVVSVSTADFAELTELARRVRACPGIRTSTTCPVIEG